MNGINCCSANKQLCKTDGDLQAIKIDTKSQKASFPKREKWKKSWDFLFAMVGLSVGLGNVWRFPYLCFKNGGGAFLIPYLVFAALVGIPILILEASLGQRVRRGILQSWSAVPAVKGIGFSGFVTQIYSNVHYIIILVWTFKYLVNSFKSELPWASCDNGWNTVNCVEMDKLNANGSSSESDINRNISKATNVTAISAAEEYWNREVLGLSSGIEDIGSLRWDLALYLLILWIGVYFSTFQGIKLTAKVAYVTTTLPYILITVVLIRGLTLDGAMEGVKYYVIPDLKKLGKVEVWADAASQVLYSYSVGGGAMVAMGSYNDKHHDFIKDAFLIAFMNFLASFTSGFAVFSTLGFMANHQNTTVDQVAQSGPGLTFIAYPEALSLIEFPQLWCVLFFLMLLSLGFDSQFVLQESISSFFMDNIPWLQKHRHSRKMLQAALGIPMCLVGLLMVTEGGAYVFEMFNMYAVAGWAVFFTTALESIAIGWMYGADKYWLEVEKMLGKHRLKQWLKIVWKYIAPFLCTCFAVYNLAQVRAFKYGSYSYPHWAKVMAIMLSFSYFGLIPIYALYQIAQVLQGRKRWIEIIRDPKVLDPETKRDCLDDSFSEEKIQLRNL